MDYATERKFFQYLSLTSLGVERDKEWYNTLDPVTQAELFNLFQQYQRCQSKSPSRDLISEAVYCLVEVIYDEEFPNDLTNADLTLVGTCFAITKHHLLTDLDTTSTYENIGIARKPYRSGKINTNDFHLVSRYRSASFQSKEGWSIFVLNDQSCELAYLPIISDKMQVPLTADVSVYNYPINVYLNPNAGVMSCDTIATTIYGYQSKKSESNNVQRGNLCTLSEPILRNLHDEQIVIRHGRAAGSYGGPFCLSDGSVLALHIKSCYDYDCFDYTSNSNFYSIGHVLCECKEFLDVYNELLGQK